MTIHTVIDSFCGVGGISHGWYQAGWRVIGIDHGPQPDYPYEFHQGDVFQLLPELVTRYHPTILLGSPPCQASSALTKGTNQGKEYPQLIPAFRQLCLNLGLPYIMENVQGSDLRRDLTLCGEMFGLGVIRHRYFEMHQVSAPQPAHIPHRGRVRGIRHGVYYDGPYLAVYGEGGYKGTVSEWQEAMGIHWTTTRKSIAEAVPPAYAQYIAEHLAL